jgi:PIN domain nuclease of toxin-antitoxin system
VIPLAPVNGGMRALLDTHAWIWWVTEDRRLSRRAKAAIATARGQQDLWLSLISVWEVAKKVEKQQLVLDRTMDQWLDEALAMPGLGVWEITRPILVQSCDLPRPFHGDPADQILVATARCHGAVLVTKDQEIRRYAHVTSLW